MTVCGSDARVPAAVTAGLGDDAAAGPMVVSEARRPLHAPMMAIAWWFRRNLCGLMRLPIHFSSSSEGSRLPTPPVRLSSNS